MSALNCFSLVSNSSMEFRCQTNFAIIMTAVSEMLLFVLIIVILVTLQHCGHSHHHSHKGHRHSHHRHGSRFHHHNHRHPYRRSSSLFHPHYHPPPPQTFPFPFYNLPYLFNSASLHTRPRCKSRRRIILKVPYPIIHKVPIYKQIAIPLNVPIKVPLKLNFNIKTEKNGSNKKINYQATYDEEEEDHGTTNADNGLQSIDPQHAQPNLYPFLYNPSDNSLLSNDENSELTKNFNVQLNSDTNNQEIESDQNESDENDSKQLIKLRPKDFENEEHNNKKSLFELSQPGRYSSVTLGKMYRQLNDRYNGRSNLDEESPVQKTSSSNDKELDDNGEEIESYAKDIILSENDLQTDSDEDGNNNNNQDKANLNDDEESDETNSFASRTSGYDNNNNKNSKINNNQINSNFVQSNYQTS